MEKLYKIECPDTDKYEIGELLEPLIKNENSAMDLVQKANMPEYLNWKDLKYKKWIPDCYKGEKEKFWGLIKFLRKQNSVRTVIRDQRGKLFTWEKLSNYDQLFHEIDLDMSKYLLDFSGISVSDNKKFQISGIIEEAIASSQLEGAHTTRRVAKQMIQEKRLPVTHAEKMIYNNYKTMTAIQDKYKDTKLSIEVLQELHRMLSVGTMPESEQGQFRSPTDQIVIQKGDDPTVISYVAPPIGFVKKELLRFIDFANDELKETNFTHPLIKAIMLHFWMGLLHPFVDGNGRLARGLFYWYLLRKGYWAFAFLPISVAIKRAPARYSEAYVLSEQDDNNLTYFIDYHVKKIYEAIGGFKEYLRKKSSEHLKIAQILQNNRNLNRRQMEALISLKNNPNRLLNVTAYVNIYNVTKATAINDLKGLVNLGYIEGRRQGRNVYYFPTTKVEKIIK